MRNVLRVSFAADPGQTMAFSHIRDDLVLAEISVVQHCTTVCASTFPVERTRELLGALRGLLLCPRHPFRRVLQLLLLLLPVRVGATFASSSQT
jgi:hypothetical protein